LLQAFRFIQENLRTIHAGEMAALENPNDETDPRRAAVVGQALQEFTEALAKEKDTTWQFPNAQPFYNQVVMPAVHTSICAILDTEGNHLGVMVLAGKET